jgi:hypothetical protein
MEVFTDLESGTAVKSGRAVAIYARLVQGNGMPVVAASVIAKVYRPLPSAAVPRGNNSRNLNVTSDYETVVELVLRDNGLGYPDVTASDGVYSGYFTALSAPGHYSVLVFADHNEGEARTARLRRSDPQHQHQRKGAARKIAGSAAAASESKMTDETSTTAPAAGQQGE